jgi:type II secretory pathway pseudopilin PulG
MELLTVILIISILLVLLAPAFTNLKSANDVTSAANSIKAVLENARTYAKANNTYVFVGFVEVNASVDPSVSPQGAGYGRVAVAAVASKDGTRDWTATNLTPIGKLQVYENLHFVPLNFPLWTQAAHPNSNMARPSPTPAATYTLGISSSVTPFNWPLGGGQYSFTKVINFDPGGTARIATATNSDEVTNVMEIDFQQSHGTVTPTPPTSQDAGNHFVIQIDAPTGAVRLYRP